MRREAGEDNELTPGERAHLRHRDRKRLTTMVVDNAGIKRVAQAIAQRKRRSGTSTKSPR
ncbi:MAG: hypothetical protein ABR564_05775 [Candidatus Dormibacteria bacterium]